MAKSGPRSNARPRASAERPRPSKKRPARTRKPPATRATRQTKTRASTRKATATRKGSRAGSAKRATRTPTTRATTTTSKDYPRTPRASVRRAIRKPKTRATTPASKAKPKTPRAADAKRRRVRPPGIDRPRRVLADIDPSIGRVTGAVRPDGSSSADTPVPVRSRTPGRGATPAETPVATAGSLADLIARIRAEKM